MASKKSYDPNFRVAPTTGKAAEGEDSLAALNETIMKATTTAQIFTPMKRICAACATLRKLIIPGFCKVRGDPEDFLNAATIHYVQRWQNEKTQQDELQATGQITGRKLTTIQNWIPYISSTIRFELIIFNKSVQDFDFLPLPTLLEDREDSTGTTRDVPVTQDDPLNAIALEELTHRDNLHSVLLGLPEELLPYSIDILYYIRTKGNLISSNTLNYVKLGRYFMSKEVAEWMT